MTTFDHAHAYVRFRRGIPTPLLLLALRCGLGRFVFWTGPAPHHADCTPAVGVTEGD